MPTGCQGRTAGSRCVAGKSWKACKQRKLQLPFKMKSLFASVFVHFPPLPTLPPASPREQMMEHGLAPSIQLSRPLPLPSSAGCGGTVLQQQGREDLGQWGQRRSWPGIYRGPCSGEVPSKKMIRPECLICGCWARSCGHKLTHLILKHAPKCFPSICRLYLEGVSWWHPLGNGDCVCAKTETGCW